jgi:tetratricopeptide (TPR) repeat protein
MRWARVASHNLAATYQGKSVDARSVGHELNVRYVLNGAIHRAGDGVTVSAQLVEARNGAQAWNDRLEFTDTKDASAKEMLVAQLTGRLATALWNAERNRATAPPPTDASAMDVVLHGWNVWTKDPNSVKGALEARKLFDRALAQEPGLVPALVGRATTIEYELDYAQRPDRARLLQELDDLTFRAVNIDSNDSGAWLRRGDALLRQHRWEGGFQAIASARRLEPTWVLPLIAHGSALVVTGRSQQAVGLIDQALALHPQDNQELGSALIVRCHANLALGRYDEAISDCEGSAAQDDSWWAHALLTAAYAQKGDGGKAAIEKAALLRQRPQTTIARLRDDGSDHPLYAQQREAHIYAGLRRAGIPEQ